MHCGIPDQDTTGHEGAQDPPRSQAEHTQPRAVRIPNTFIHRVRELDSFLKRQMVRFALTASKHSVYSSRVDAV